MKWIQKNSDWIIISILTIISVSSIIQRFINDSPFLIRNYLAYVILIGLVVLKVLRFRRTRTVLGAILIVGTFNALLFTYRDIFISFYIGKLTFFGFQPVSFFALVGLVLSDFKGARTVIKSLIPKDSLEDQEQNHRRSVDRFKDKFGDYTQEKLKEITNNPNSYQDYAVIAAQELLENE